MRIVIATRYNFVVGGVETYLAALLPALRARGHEVGLAYERASADKAEIDSGRDGPRFLLHEPGAIAAIEAWKPDLAYGHGLERIALEEAILDRFPAAAHVHNYAATCISGSKSHLFPTIRACQRPLGPACLAIYLPRRCGGLNPVTMVDAYQTARANLHALKRYGVVLVASPPMSDECANNGVSRDRLHTIPPLPQSVAGATSPPAARGKAGVNVLFMGRLVPLKGVRLLVDAMALAGAKLGRPLHLDVTGEGPEREALIARAKRKELSMVLHGWVARARLPALLERADVLAVPSIWPEPFGVVGIEAGALGLPSVAFATGGIPSWLRPGISGELAPTPPTAEGLASALVRALGDPAHLDSLRAGAWQVAQEFSLANHMARLEAALTLAAGRPPASPG